MFSQYGNLYRTIADIKFQCIFKCALYAYNDETQSDKHDKGKTLLHKVYLNY